MTTPRLGVCYYPEHWPEEIWPRDAARMREIGLTQVRIAEFAWSRIEPTPGAFQWNWLDRAIDNLGAHGLEVMIGTPTATPPKWLIDSHPEILAIGADGRERRFGSRRHYCFSAPVYRTQAVRITTAMAQRYGKHEAVTAWQTDNEYGCHQTVRSYSANAAAAFRNWLAAKYVDIKALNDAWGAVFWSQEYTSFASVDLPIGLVTEANPAHLLDYYRFSSDQVISFNRLQTDVIRAHSPGRKIVHNAMGQFFDFDHFALGQDIDSIGWDSYPLGFLVWSSYPDDIKKRYMRQGHPDFAAFHHDLYRGCGKGDWEVCEQQPGPVNWAPYNPAPLPGMVRAWGAEALAHGASTVSYFRLRQAPFAQEQTHAGLLRPDDAPAPAYEEVKTLCNELSHVAHAPEQGDVALVFSYEAQWAFEADRHGSEWSYPDLCMDFYTALRRVGLNVDILQPDADLSAYKLVICPSLPIMSETAIAAFSTTEAITLFGPRTGSRDNSFKIPGSSPLGQLFAPSSFAFAAAETFPRDYRINGTYQGSAVSGGIWLDHIETDASAVSKSDEGPGLLYQFDRRFFLSTVPDTNFLENLLPRLAQKAGLPLSPVPADIRRRRIGDRHFVINYGPDAIRLGHDIAPEHAEFLAGDRTLPPAAYAVFRLPNKIP